MVGFKSVHKQTLLLATLSCILAVVCVATAMKMLPIKVFSAQLAGDLSNIKVILSQRETQ